MNIVASSPFQVGGSLSGSAPSYVTRQADQLLYQALQQGDLCYVFNARQMGKSSLRVRTMQRLTAEGVACLAIDLTAIGIQQVTPEQWYASIAALIVQGFRLPISLGTWWRELTHLSFVARLQQLIETVLLEQISGPIVIFVDEVDSVLGLSFSAQDFFGFLRHCYEQRSLNPAYERLSFVLLGVATPCDLISDPQATPFNIGRAIELTGFQWVEAVPLVAGLKSHFAEPQQLLQTVLAWTDGQPFLTQKLCDLLYQQREQLKASHLNPTDWVSQIVRQGLIDNWEGQDEPEHFRTIRDRLLHEPILASQLLTQYQRLLLSPTGHLPLDNSSQQRTLLLSGLVKQQHQAIQVKNPIYEAIFDATWVDQQLGLLARDPAVAELLARAAAPPPAAPPLESQPEGSITPEVEPVEPVEPIPPSLTKPTQPQRWPLVIAGGSLFGLGLVSGWLSQNHRLHTAYEAQAQADLQTATALAIDPAIPLPTKLFHAIRAYQTTGDRARKTRSRQLLQTLVSQVTQPDWHQAFRPDSRLIQAQFQPDSQGIWGLNQAGHLQTWPPQATPAQATLQMPPLKLLQRQPQQDIGLDRRNRLWLSRQPNRPTPAFAQPIIQLSSNADGSTIALLQQDGLIELWDRQPQRLRQLKLTGQIHQVQFHPQQYQIAVALSQSSGSQLPGNQLPGNQLPGNQLPDRHSLQFWDIESWTANAQPQQNITVPDRLTGIAWQADGTALWGISKHQLFHWSADGTALGQWQLPTTSAQTIAVHPTFALIAIGDAQGRITLWKGDQLLTQRQLPPEPIHSLAFSGNGQSLLSATATQISRWPTAALLQPDSDLVQACQQLRDYLKTAPDLSASDRQRCDRSP